MNNTKKITVVLIAIVLGVIISPAIALSDEDAMKQSVELEDTINTSDITKTVRIVGLEEMSFAPNTINITHVNTVNFLNVDGSNGVISVQIPNFPSLSLVHTGLTILLCAEILL